MHSNGLIEYFQFGVGFPPFPSLLCTFGLFVQGIIFPLSSVYLHNLVLTHLLGVGFVFDFFVFGFMAYLAHSKLFSLLIQRSSLLITLL